MTDTTNAPEGVKDVEDVSSMTGENASRRIVRNLEMNEVRFNGKEGKFTHIALVDKKDGEKAVETDLGSSIDFVFLKIRRRIQGFKKGNKSLREFDEFYTSTEHNAKDDQVYLFGPKDKGTAEEMYNKYQNSHKMRAQRVIYGFLLREGKERELVRLVVKGSTLNPNRDSKIAGKVDFFDYINAKKPKGEHTYMFVTTISAVEEDGQLGKIYSMEFVRGARLPEDKLRIVVEEVKRIHAHTVEQDAYYKDTDASSVAPEAAVPTVEYPTEDIDPEDIPF